MRLAKIVEDYKKYPAETQEGLKNALKEKAITANDFSIQELFVECYGYGELRRARVAQEIDLRKLSEAAGAVTSDAFQNITLQYAYQAVLDAYDVPERVFSRIIPTRPSVFKWERVPGITNIGDTAQTVEEGKDYPEVGVGEDWIDTPETKKRGFIIPVTRETILFDQTREVISRCDKAGEWLEVNEEKKAVACVVDSGETKDNQYQYRWRNNQVATYGASSGFHNWVNLLTATPLGDYTTIQKAWQLLVQILDPYTGEPQNVSIKDIVVPPALAFQVPFALKGMVKRTAPGYATSGNPTQTGIDNPVGDIIGQIRTLSTQLLRVASGDDTTWYIGDIAAAFEQIENWPLQVTNIGAGNLDEFKRDVVFQIKASKRATFVTKNPRKMVKVQAS